MNKPAFLEKLKSALAGLPQNEIDERMAFYSEMIEDRMEDGLTEEEAVQAVGSVEEIVSQVVADTPLTRIVKENIKPKRRLKTWETVLLILGSPIWFSLLVAAFAVIFALYICLWSGIISLWAGFVSLAACGFAGVIAGIVFAVTGHGIPGLATIGASMVCAGLAILWFFCCRAITKSVLVLTKKMALGIKHRLIKKEEAL